MQSTAPTDQVSNQEVDSDVAASTAPAMATNEAMFLAGEGVIGGSSASVSSGSAGAGVLTSSPCTVHSRGDTLTFSRESKPDTVAFALTWEYFSASGCQNAFDAASTDSIDFTASVLEADHDPRFVSRATRDWKFSVFGMPTLKQADTHVWNGTGTESDTAVHETPGVDKTYSGSAVDTASAITFPHPLNGAFVPTSGSLSRWIAWSMTMTTKGVHKSREVERHIVITFNGTTQVPLQIYNATSGVLEMTCTLDLVTRRIVEGSCH
jgi:hypothetical protein